ncbi:MAG: PilZ domain-containing protein [Vicinamibacteria bacterium]|nr:PilZ domain-containing protein [Vicinamibacteria bacterium]
MKTSYQGKVILRVLICSRRDLRSELADTLIGRQGIEVYRVEKFADARLVGSSLGVQVILVDRDFPSAASFIRQLRQEPATRDRSIAVLARGSRPETDSEVLAAGANAILGMPPDAGWDERFSKLLTVPVRQQARLLVHIEVMSDPEYPAAILNLSPGGMLLATHRALQVGEEIGFRFTLPDKTNVAGRGRVARDARPAGFGIEFIDIEGDGRDAVLAFLRSARLG